MAIVQTIEVRTQRHCGVVWSLNLERWYSASGTSTLHIHFHGGQSYPVGTYRSLKAARQDLNSFGGYVIDSEALANRNAFEARVAETNGLVNALGKLGY